jgi:hypothetical protein
LGRNTAGIRQVKYPHAWCVGGLRMGAWEAVSLTLEGPIEMRGDRRP